MDLAALQAEVIKDRGRLDRLPRPAFGGWQYVTATFLAATTPVVLPHRLTANPEDVRWLVVSLNAEAIVFRDAGTPWPSGAVILQASAPCVARLLLFVEPSNA